MSLSLEPPKDTPQAVKKIAATLGINLSDTESLQFLSVARLLLILPLPTNFKHALDEQGRSLYIDKRTGLTKDEHPNLPAAKKLLAELKSRAAQEKQQGSPQDTGSPGAEDPAAASPGQEGSQGDGQPLPPATCMQFTRESDGSKYIYDFSKDAEVGPDEPEPAPEALIMYPSSEALKECGLVSTPPQETKKLRFYSWWYEDIESRDLTFRVSTDSVVGGGLERRYVTVDFDLASNSFTIRTVTDEQEVAVGNILAVMSKTGGMVEVWDLHVGTTLNIMGRQVPLLKADLETALWNEFHAKRLLKLKGQLLAELQKYRPRAHKAAVAFDRKDQVANGGLSLRHTVNQINAMLEELRTYRPAKASMWQERVKIPI